MNSFHLPYPAEAAALEAALPTDPFYATMERSVQGTHQQQREAMVRYMDYSMQEGNRYGALTLVPGIAGAAVWSRPMSPSMAKQCKQEKHAFLQSWMGESSLQTYMRIVDFMSSQLTGNVDEGAWYLSILGLSPEQQGRQLGQQLIQPILAEADAEGVHTFLETFVARNKSFYQRLGFAEKAILHEPVTNSPYWLMVRSPQVKQ